MAAPAACLPHSGNTVCVMDASGILGSSLVQRLLRRGYTVHAAVQNHHGESYRSLKAQSAGGNKKLKIFQSDPFDYQSIMEALSGCTGLFYTFEPPSDQSLYDEHMADVEIRAAHNVLEACAQTDAIDKVVFTSSATSVVWTNDRSSSSSDIDERNWSDINLCRKYKLWYALSKTLAEKTAWALAMDRGINMVTVNAGLLMSSDITIKNPYLKGAAEMYEDGIFVTVNLSFLADAHICIFEEVSSYGRYLCFDRVINNAEDAMELARTLTPSSSPQPQRYEQDMGMIQQRISNKKLNKLMVDFESGPKVD